jgi:hypothetical protein
VEDKDECGGRSRGSKFLSGEDKDIKLYAQLPRNPQKLNDTISYGAVLWDPQKR